MSWPQLLADYGYWAVLVGSLLEGETILLLAGFAAFQGYLSLPLVILIAFVGGTLGDQVFYWIGRRWGIALLRRYPRLRQAVREVRALLLRYHAGLIVGVRFMYGLRILGPVAIGMSDVAPRRFLVFNALGAALWAPLVPSIGYVFGESLQAVFGFAQHYEWLLLAVLVALLWGVIAWRGRRRRGRRR